MSDIRGMSADSRDHMADFDPDVSAVSLSHAFFGRADWALMFSCYACLWSEVFDKGLMESNALINLLKSDKLR